MDESTGTVNADNFPEQIAQNYQYSDAMEAYGGDQNAAAQEVRDDVKDVIDILKDKVPAESLERAMTDFVRVHPAGQDLDSEFGALSFGLADELAESLKKDIYEGIDQASIDTIEAYVSSIHGAEKTTRIEFRFDIVAAIKAFSPEERKALLKHADERTHEPDDYVPHLLEAAKVVKKGGLKALKQFEHDLGWE